ncbi:unnamed protein product [Kluyveromyces dobzhanskii CBS 2104]|uniref:Genetic interactor of prohibitin 5, mitochondrial n=1 Tax=Kluyveromyces dobzhanskii CBS 2104 TaxID=1427455 RepID=A0A0A8LBK8_9SACH|nr:unnamed protein product [Kluyveromyces dobzhanskii CBS 2104]
MRARLLRTSKLYKNLHPVTKDAISKLVTCPENKQHEAWRRLDSFNENPSRKTLEKLIFSVHYHLLNKPPHHIQILSENRNEIAKFWPYETSRSILEIDNQTTQSQSMLWSRNSKEALSSVSFERHQWLKPDMRHVANEELIKKITQVEELQSIRPTDNFRIPEDSIKEALRLIFQHYYFLKTNPKLCLTKKLKAPIVEIGVKPDGFDIADVRINKLFEKKVLHVTRLLSTQNPALSEDAEAILMRIMSDPDLNRPTKRLYKSVTSRSYTFKDGKFEISELARDGFVLETSNSDPTLTNVGEDEHE